MTIRLFIVTVITVLLNLTLLFVCPILFLYNLMGILGGTNLLLDGFLSFFCVYTFYALNKELGSFIVRHFNYYLTYVITNGAISMVAANKEEYFKLLDDYKKTAEEEKANARKDKK